MNFITLKKYVKSPGLAMGTLCFICYLVGSLILNNGKSLAIQAISCVLKVQQVCFLFFLFVSYELFSKSKRCCCEEVLGSVKYGKLKEKMYALRLLLIEMLCVSVCLFLFVYCHGENSKAYFEYCLKLISIHNFLLCLFAVLLGVLLSETASRVQAYTVMMLLYILFGSKIITSLQQMSYSNDLFYRFTDLLGIYSRDYDTLSDSYYLTSVENVNIERIFVWLFFTGGIFLILKMKRWKKCLAVFLFGLSIFVSKLFFQPTSAVNIDFGSSGQDVLTTDDTYYRVDVDCEDTSQYEEAKFKVKGYKAEFSAERQLQAKVTVAMEKNTLEQYAFTLYHGYKIKKIEDSCGNSVKFQQSGDYVTVSGGEDTLTFYYEGYCKRYYSTSQGMYLPAYHSYYPMPGKRRVYWWTYGYYGNSLESLGYPVNFDVTIKTGLEVACNLKQIGENHFVGVSDGVTVFASNFLNKTVLGDCTVVTSRLSEEGMELKVDESGYGESYRTFADNYSNNQHQAKMIFVPPYLNGEFYYFGNDHVIGDIDSLEFHYQEYQATGSLYDFISEEEVQRELESQMEEE